MFNLRRIRPIRQRIRSFSPQGSSFNPASLSGFVAEFNPSRSLATGNLWQNAAKTTPATANNDPVRVVVDPLSGIEWTAPSDAARGLLKISGSYAWIQFDGSDDRYDSTATVSSLGMSATMTLSSSVSFAASNFMRAIAAWGSSNNSFIFGRAFSNPHRMEFVIQTSGTGIITESSTPSINQKYSYIATHVSGSQVLYRDGVSVATGSLSGSISGTNNITVGAGDDGGFMNGQIGGVVLFNQVLSSDNISTLNSYLLGLLV